MQLKQILLEKQVVLFCGAGISLEPPAGLPDWHKLRDYTLEAISSKEKILGHCLGNLTNTEMIGSPGKKGLTPEIVASVISRNCEGYFSCFQSLEQGEPNANHCALALLAKAGYTKYILTTNFDLFLEKAMTKEGLAYKVYRTKEEFASFSGQEDGLHICKLHGCISQPETITTTVEQEAKGLSLEKKHVLEYLLPLYHFLFWGYSGADLKIDLDYLAMTSMEKKAKGFIWHLWQQEDYTETINPYVDELLQLYQKKAQVVYAQLPQAFSCLEKSITVTQYTPEQRNQWQEQKNKQIQESLQNWAEQNVTSDKACQIFGSLLNHHGQLDAALHCFEKSLEICKETDQKGYLKALLNAGIVYKTKELYEKALSYFEKCEKLAISQNHCKEQVSSLNNSGVIYASQQQYDKAVTYFSKSLEIARKQKFAKEEAASLNNLGAIYSANKEYTQALEHYEQAIIVAKELGDRQAMASRLNNIAQIYIMQQEYDKALENYKKYQEIASSLGDKQGLATALYNITMTYTQKQEFQQAAMYHKKYIELKNEITGESQE